MYIVNTTNVTMNKVADQSIRYCDGLLTLLLKSFTMLESLTLVEIETMT